MLVAKVRVKVLSTYVASSTRRFLNVYEDLKQSCRIQQHQCPLSRTPTPGLYQSSATLLHCFISSAHALPPINPTPHTFLFGLHTACIMLATLTQRIRSAQSGYLKLPHATTTPLLVPSPKAAPEPQPIWPHPLAEKRVRNSILSRDTYLHATITFCDTISSSLSRLTSHPSP